MFNNIALDVFIGLVFVFLLYSLLATIIQEMIATRFAFRSKVLEKAILRMLEDGKTTTKMPFGDRIMGFWHLLGLINVLKDKPVATWFYAHPLIKYLGEDNYYSKPAYIDAANFSKVMIDLLKGFNQPESQMVQAIHNSVMNGTIYQLPIKNSSVQFDKSNPAFKNLIKQERAQQVILSEDASITGSQTVAINPNTALFLKSLWQEAGADVDVFKSKLEQWFNDTMDRATGWYKRYTRVILFIVGIIVAWMFNVDTIAIHRILSTNKTARDQMVQMAISQKDNLNPDKVLNNQSDSLLKETYKMVAADASKSNDVLGLGKPWKDSCKICSDSFPCKENRKAKVKKDFEELSEQMKSYLEATEVLDSSQKQLARMKDSLAKGHIKGAARIALESDTSMWDKKISLALTVLEKSGKVDLPLLKDSLKRLADLYALSKRCDTIQNRKCLQFSPNQAGGFETLLGWLITALAITLGAPFWFDLLSKLIDLRGAGNASAPATDNNAPTSGSTPSSGSAANGPVINVNSSSGEEAVG
jgi:hypothetical protein